MDTSEIGYMHWGKKPSQHKRLNIEITMRVNGLLADESTLLIERLVPKRRIPLLDLHNDSLLSKNILCRYK